MTDAPKKTPFSFTSTTVPPGAGSSAHAPHSSLGAGNNALGTSRRTASNVSVPELTLTTDVESLGAGFGLGIGTPGGNDVTSTSPSSSVAPAAVLSRHQSIRSSNHSRNASAHSRTPSITMSPSASSVPQLYTPPPSSPSSVSRRHLTKIQDPTFWSALHKFLAQELLPGDDQPGTSSLAHKESKDGLASLASVPGSSGSHHAPSASTPIPPPTTTAGLGHGRSPSLSRRSHSRTTSLSLRPPGEAEVQRLWEDFFVSQKRHLTSSEVARVRDQTGFFGM